MIKYCDDGGRAKEGVAEAGLASSFPFPKGLAYLWGWTFQEPGPAHGPSLGEKNPSSVVVYPCFKVNWPKTKGGWGKMPHSGLKPKAVGWKWPPVA